MTYAKSLLAASISLLSAGTLLSGCILTSSNGDGSGTDGADDGDGGPGGATTPNPDDGQDDTGNVPDGTGGDTDGDTGELPLPCGTNVLEDPGFESGTPSAAWTEASAGFPSPICDAGCTEDPGAGPYDGDWWVWFGGVEEPEIASVGQTFTITGDTAELQFALSINAAAGTGNDFVQAHIDDTEVFIATDAEMADFDGYTAVTVDISQFADGAEHLLVISADLTGEGLTNFFVDAVSVSACDGGSGSDTGGSGTATDTGADGTTAGDTGVTSTGGTTGSTGTSGGTTAATGSGTAG